MSTFHIYCTLITNSSEQLAEYIIAAAFYRKNADDLIHNTLKAIYMAPQGWQGNEILNAAVMILNSLASIPDDHQTERINFIMQCQEGLNNHPLGLIKASLTWRSNSDRISWCPEVSTVRRRNIILGKARHERSKQNST